ncbi:RNA recognition motif [Carpediemonas membranifera]|uniref:RNA recognition motif n=1 Tax=Carpediemonas membranifera TaxID=201153 RepID=A0A8J6AYA8_9EUKA|nr:RNA recognition motif [Carpediemonas membranifera]|eukprot:KAG9397063.1 RNA recognition motif [Carpediemonas membranifera]
MSLNIDTNGSMQYHTSSMNSFPRYYQPQGGRTLYRKYPRHGDLSDGFADNYTLPSESNVTRKVWIGSFRARFTENDVITICNYFADRVARVCRPTVNTFAREPPDYMFLVFDTVDQSLRARIVLRDYYHLNTGYAEEKHLSEALAEANDPENRNVYFASLPLIWDEAALAELASSFGPLESTAIMRRGGRSRGTGFVMFKTREAAARAVDTLHQSTPPNCSQPVTVRFADTRQQKEIRKTFRMTEQHTPTVTPETIVGAYSEVSRRADKIPENVPSPNEHILPPPAALSFTSFGHSLPQSPQPQLFQSLHPQTAPVSPFVSGPMSMDIPPPGFNGQFGMFFMGSTGTPGYGQPANPADLFSSRSQSSNV